MKLAVAILFAFMTSTIFAQMTKTKILHLTVDISKTYGEVYMYNNEEGDIDHFQWEIHNEEGLKDSDTFTPEDVRNGTVFKKGIPKKFVTVIADNFTESYGGAVQIRYPENAITGRYNTEAFELERNSGDNQESWPINHRTKKDFKRVHVIVNKFLGAPIGADRIEFLD